MIGVWSISTLQNSQPYHDYVQGHFQFRTKRQKDDEIWNTLLKQQKSHYASTRYFGFHTTRQRERKRERERERYFSLFLSLSPPPLSLSLSLTTKWHSVLPYGKSGSKKAALINFLMGVYTSQAIHPLQSMRRTDKGYEGFVFFYLVISGKKHYLPSRSASHGARSLNAYLGSAKVNVRFSSRKNNNTHKRANSTQIQKLKGKKKKKGFPL